MAQLENVLAVVLVDGPADRSPERDVPIVIDHRVVRHDPPAQLYGYERRHDRPDASFGELRFPVDARLIARAVVVVEPSRHVRSEHTVLDGEIPELQWLEDRVKRHT